MQHVQAFVISTRSRLRNRMYGTAYAHGANRLITCFSIIRYLTIRLQIFTAIYIDKEKHFDAFTKIDFAFDTAVASIKVGRGVKSEGDLVVTGTKDIFMYPLHGGRQIILKSVMNSRKTIEDIIISSMVKAYAMNW